MTQNNTTHKSTLSPLDWFGRKIANYLSKSTASNLHIATNRPENLASTLRKGDVLLVEGVSRISNAIKYITQSTWSHAALCVSDGSDNSENIQLVEADMVEGVRLVPLSEYWNQHTRICRPIGLKAKDIESIINHASQKIGHQYDLKHIFDLARYLIQTPPVPVNFRRRLLALGSGEPTKAICSSLIAESFQSVRYPILPTVENRQSNDPQCSECISEYLHIRHHSLYAPRDFDISPYFQIIKPTLEQGFSPYNLNWNNPESEVN
jgi:hypothetical protein